jgi:DNA gyrase/topoisomerase IV subunit A
MQKTLVTFIISLFPFSIAAQLQSTEHDKLLQVLLSDEFTYDNKENLFSTRNGLVLKTPVTEFFTIQEREFVVIWLQPEESNNMFSQVAIYQYRKLKKGFERVDKLIIREEQRTWQMEASTTTLGEKEVIEIKAGYDSDGDGDEITYYLVLPQEETLTLILDCVLESSSGDGCDGSRLESSITISETLTDGFPNIQVEESNYTFDSCDENFENTCTAIKKYTYVWDGSTYNQRN